MLAGFSLSCFLAPNDIIAGGVSGVATIINHFSSLPIGLMIVLINVPIFVWGIIKFGKSLGIATLYATIALSIFTDLFCENYFEEVSIMAFMTFSRNFQMDGSSHLS